VKLLFGREKVGRIEGSLRRAVMFAGVLDEIIDLSGGIVEMVS
jgi:hypothetical protein